jgi:sugar fermentation stimulation protein A
VSEPTDSWVPSLSPANSDTGDDHSSGTEVRYGTESSRIDVLADDAEGRAVYIEVKNTTLRIDTPEGPVICFPDAVTSRGAKHLRELRGVVRDGHRAAAVFFVHRGDGTAFAVARTIDPEYTAELEAAAAEGVEVLPLRVELRAVQDSADQWTITWGEPGLLPWRRGPGS